jgi:uncharacterized lipoprotein YmbA
MSLGPRPDSTRYYVLDPGAGETASSTRPPIAALAVGPIRLPAYLDRREIVTRAGPTRLELASGERWAAPLDVLFATVLAERLRDAVPAREVHAEPWPAGGAPEWAVAVEVLRFEGEPDGTAVLEARFTVTRRGEPAGRGATAARERGPSGDPAATAAALSKTVGALARDVAAAIAAGRADGG